MSEFMNQTVLLSTSLIFWGVLVIVSGSATNYVIYRLDSTTSADQAKRWCIPWVLIGGFLIVLGVMTKIAEAQS